MYGCMSGDSYSLGLSIIMTTAVEPCLTFRDRYPCANWNWPLWLILYCWSEFWKDSHEVQQNDVQDYVLSQCMAISSHPPGIGRDRGHVLQKALWDAANTVESLHEVVAGY